MSLETCASSKFMTFITVHATSFIQEYNAFFNVMFICAFVAALLFLAKLDHMIKFKASEALYNATVLFKQFACTFLI